MRTYLLGIGLKLITRPNKAEASLWRRLHFDGDVVCRENLFDIHRDFARKLAKKQYYRCPSYGLELFDFEQLAYMGLLEAIDQYNPLKNVPFNAYARYRINGRISDGLSKSSENSALYTHRQRLEAERARSLSIDAKDNDPIAQLSALAVGLALGFILEGTGPIENRERVDPAPSAYETLSWRELQLTLRGEIEKLPGSEKTVVDQHYLQGVAFTQIAKLLKVTKGRVSQIHRSAITQLRKTLGVFR